MSWGVDYTYRGYISHITKDQIPGELEDCESRIELAWRELLAYAQQTPPVYDEPATEDDYRQPWPEFLACKLGQIRKALEEDYGDKFRYRQCLKVMEDHPENVVEG